MHNTNVPWRHVVVILSIAYALLPCRSGQADQHAKVPAQLTANRPNIVMIFSDDQGMNDVGCYGSEIETPALDQLASEGIRLTQFYAASSICTPSRFGLLTGRYPHRSQDHLLSALMFLSEDDKVRGIRAGETTYASRLQQLGYRTALVGKWHLGHGDQMFWPTQHGFDSFFGHTGGCVDFFTLNYGNRADWYRGSELVTAEGYATDVITEEAISVLESSRDSGQPLYLHVAYNAPHFGKGWNQDKASTQNLMQPKPDDLKLVSHIEDPLRRSFAAKVVGMDASIGKLMAALNKLEMQENTIVIFMTDHGGDYEYGGSNLPFRGEKATLFEGGLRVPCIVRWPGHVMPNSVSDRVSCAIDWYPTFAEVLGIDVPAGLDGVSILSVLKGQSKTRSRTLKWMTGKHAMLDRKPWRAVRDGQWKWVQEPGKTPMLFDMLADPHEKNDLAESNAEVAKRLALMAP